MILRIEKGLAAIEQWPAMLEAGSIIENIPLILL